MHTYLRSIGFSNLTEQSDIENLICDVIGHANSREMFKREDGSVLVEYILRPSKSTGVKVRGEEDKMGNFHFSHYFPFALGTERCNEEAVYVNKRVDTDAYTGMCDDYRMGVSMIFYIQNLVDYFHLFKGEKCIDNAKVVLSGLAQSGKIILPTQIRAENSSVQTELNRKKNRLIIEAKKGNEEAMQSLTIDDIDNYALVNERIKFEDVFSIVDTSFVPYGSESDVYNVTGNIREVQMEQNAFSKEKIWYLLIECNEVLMNIVINEKDLLGEPKVGRRFRGTIWMQGKLEQMFEKLIP